MESIFALIEIFARTDMLLSRQWVQPFRAGGIQDGCSVIARGGSSHSSLLGIDPCPKWNGLHIG
jgi:hypothetical protein